MIVVREIHDAIDKDKRTPFTERASHLDQVTTEVCC